MTNRGYFMNKGALWKWIQEPPNVGVQHIVHLLPHQSHRKRVQCLMLAAPWSESIGKSQKVLLIDLIEDGHHGLLDDLIFHGRDAQRALSPVKLSECRSFWMAAPDRRRGEPGCEDPLADPPTRFHTLPI